jgi:hypothetical protein
VYSWHRLQDHVDLAALVRLCPNTHDYLYRPDSVASSLRYTPGQRPIIEKLLERLAYADDRLISGSAGAVFHALCEWVYWEVFRRGQVLRCGKWSRQLVAGGVEEEILGFLGRTGTFECARLLATLLQMKGIAARLLFVFQPAFHARVCVEAEVDGAWQVFDIKNRTAHGAAHSLLSAAGEAFADACLGVLDYPARDEVLKWPPNDRSQRPATPLQNGVLPDSYSEAGALAERLQRHGPPARSHDELAPYRGWRKLHGEAALVNAFHANEPSMREMVLLCADTAEYLYTEFTPIETDYVAGARPVLEGLLDTCVLRDRPRPTDQQELVFAVHDWVFFQVLFRYLSLWDLFHAPVFRYYGDDEDVASFRNRCDCYCASRLSASMLQAAGVPARLVYMQNARDRSGHTCFEAYVHGGWRFWDVSCHDHALNRDGQVASMWEIMSDDYCRTIGLRESPLKTTPILRQEYLGNCTLANYPIAATTAHYHAQDGSSWYPPESAAARQACRHGI